MKKLILKLLTIVVVTGIVFTSCENNNSDDLSTTSQSITEDQTIALVEADDVTDEIDNIVDDIVNEDFNIVAKDESSKNEEEEKLGRPNCLTKTIVLEGKSKTVTLDFGEGCELQNGHVLSGKIIMNYIFDKEAITTTIAKTFDNFFFNEVAVEGQNVIERTKRNDNGNTASVKTINVTLTWLDGKTVSRTGTRTREWLEGKDTKTWGDNVFVITGNVTTTFDSGEVFTSKIIEPLRREMACRFIVSGTVEISKGEKKGTLNYGDGTCDNKAIFISTAGEEKEITLRKRKMEK